MQQLNNSKVCTAIIQLRTLDRVESRNQTKIGPNKELYVNSSPTPENHLSHKEDF